MADSREPLGRPVRSVWVEWAFEQENPKNSWLLTWSELDDGQREVDMRIGAAVAGSLCEHIDAYYQVMVDLGWIADDLSQRAAYAIEALEHVNMDTPKDWDLHARLIATLKASVNAVIEWKKALAERGVAAVSDLYAP